MFLIVYVDEFVPTLEAISEKYKVDNEGHEISEDDREMLVNVLLPAMKGTASFSVNSQRNINTCLQSLWRLQMIQLLKAQSMKKLFPNGKRNTTKTFHKVLQSFWH